MKTGVTVTPKRRAIKYVPGGNSTSRMPDTQERRASTYRVKNDLSTCSASMRAHLFLPATFGLMPNRGARVWGALSHGCRSTRFMPKKPPPLLRKVP